MGLTEFTDVLAELIAIASFDRLFCESDDRRNEECLGYLIRQIRRNDLLKRFAILVAKN